jgi:hypothetical protein
MFRRFTTFFRDEIIPDFPVNILPLLLNILNRYFLEAAFIAHQFCRVVGQ